MSVTFNESFDALPFPSLFWISPDVVIPDSPPVVVSSFDEPIPTREIPFEEFFTFAFLVVLTFIVILSAFILPALIFELSETVAEVLEPEPLISAIEPLIIVVSAVFSPVTCRLTLSAVSVEPDVSIVESPETVVSIIVAPTLASDTEPDLLLVVAVLLFWILAEIFSSAVISPNFIWAEDCEAALKS